jgi:hypothetical protein
LKDLIRNIKNKIERDPELQRLIDESKIRNLLDKYSRALDRQGHELLASHYHLARSMTTASMMGQRQDM